MPPVRPPAVLPLMTGRLTTHINVAQAAAGRRAARQVSRRRNSPSIRSAAGPKHPCADRGGGGRGGGCTRCRAAPAQPVRSSPAPPDGPAERRVSSYESRRPAAGRKKAASAQKKNPARRAVRRYARRRNRGAGTRAAPDRVPRMSLVTTMPPLEPAAFRRSSRPYRSSPEILF